MVVILKISVPVLILEFVLHLTLYSFYVHNNSVHQGYGQSRSSLLLNCYFSYYSVELRDLVKKNTACKNGEKLKNFEKMKNLSRPA